MMIYTMYGQSSIPLPRNVPIAFLRTLGVFAFTEANDPSKALPQLKTGIKHLPLNLTEISGRILI